MLEAEKLLGRTVDLIPLTRDKIEQVRVWRNSDQVKKHFIFRDEITVDKQKRWFQSVAESMECVYFLINDKQSDIGLCEIKKIKDNSGEWGIFIFSQDARQGLQPVEASLILLNYCFKILGLIKVTAQVLSDNAAALSLNQKLGFKQVGSRIEIIDSNEEKVLELELTSKNFETQNIKLMKFFKVV